MKIILIAIIVTAITGCASNTNYISTYDLAKQGTWRKLAKANNTENIWGKSLWMVFHDGTDYESPSGVWHFYVAMWLEGDSWMLDKGLRRKASNAVLDCNNKTMRIERKLTDQSWFNVAEKYYCAKTREAKRVREAQKEEQRILLEQQETKKLEDQINTAKEVCANLGFELGTEKFGACVLEVSK